MLTEKQCQRFWSWVSKTDGCWIWMGHDFVGDYPRFSMGTYPRIRIKVHRISYLLAYGELDDGKVIHHRCENKLCVRPDHLESLTQSEHVKRHGWGSGDETCRQGHAWTPENTYLKPRKGTTPARLCLTCKRIQGRKDARLWRQRQRERSC